jgi:hypothetical protein
MLRRLLMLALATCCSCAGYLSTPSVPPDASPEPRDVFAGAMLDCYRPAAQEQRAAAALPVEGCLAGPDVGSCLVGLTSGFSIDAIGCSARDLGASANVEVLTGDAGERPRRIADAARAWIREKGLGFR